MRTRENLNFKNIEDFENLKKKRVQTKTEKIIEKIVYFFSLLTFGFTALAIVILPFIVWVLCLTAFAKLAWIILFRWNWN